MVSTSSTTSVPTRQSAPSTEIDVDLPKYYEVAAVSEYHEAAVSEEPLAPSGQCSAAVRCQCTNINCKLNNIPAVVQSERNPSDGQHLEYCGQSPARALVFASRVEQKANDLESGQTFSSTQDDHALHQLNRAFHQPKKFGCVEERLQK
jgi:hypothetical protein